MPNPHPQQISHCVFLPPLTFGITNSQSQILCMDPFTQKTSPIYVRTPSHKKHRKFMCGPRHTKNIQKLCLDPSIHKTTPTYVRTPPYINSPLFHGGYKTPISLLYPSNPSLAPLLQCKKFVFFVNFVANEKFKSPALPAKLNRFGLTVGRSIEIITFHVVT